MVMWLSAFMSDHIVIEGIQVMAHVGVSEEERKNAQLLEISLVLRIDLSAAARTERLNMSVDYAEVHETTIEVVHRRPRALIETVAEDLAHVLLTNFHLEKIDVEVRKFILEHTRYVAVRISREGRAAERKPIR
jgi:7,8-dihydroneopterin aldolase/epimerase/oxygenase